MIDELRDEKLIEKVGGRFHLSALIQKRLKILNEGAPSFLESEGTKSKLELVIQEIVEDKIYLDHEGNLRSYDGTNLEQSSLETTSDNSLFGSETAPTFGPEGQ